MKINLLSVIGLSFSLNLFQPMAFSAPMEQEQGQAQAVAPEKVVFGENPARQELMPFLQLLRSQPLSKSLRSQLLGTDDVYQLRIIYMIPANREPQLGAEEKLQHFVVEMQNWFSEKMELLGYGPKTFQYEVEADKITPKINFVYVTQSDTYFHGNYGEQWSNVLSAIATAGYPPWQRGQLILVVAEIQAQVPDGSFLASSVFFGGAAGTNFSGVGMVTGETLARLSETFLTDNRLYEGLVIPEIGPYPLVQNVSFPWYEGSTLSSTSSSAQGGAMHELGHGLGLWHNFQNDTNFNGNLMGNGFRGIRGAIFPKRYPNDNTRLAAGSALQLNYSRFFNPGQTFREDNPPQAEILTMGTVIPQNGLCQLDFIASDADSSLGGALLIRADHVVAGIPLDGEQVSSTISTYNYTPGMKDEWYLLVFDTQGNTTLSAKTLVTCAEGYNRAPHPYIKVSKSRVEVGEGIMLNAEDSFDPGNNFSQLRVEWDLDGDGNFDTRSSTTKTYNTVYMKPGIYQIIAKLTDEQGASSLSMPIGIKVISSFCSPPKTNQQGFNRSVNGDRSGIAECVNVNDQLSFTPILSTFSTSTESGVQGCPVTFQGGVFSFEAQLTNASTPSLTNLGIQVTTLTRGNALLLDNGATGGAGATLSVPNIGGYTDGILDPGEQIAVPFTVCLKSRQPFVFFVDVFGQVKETD